MKAIKSRRRRRKINGSMKACDGWARLKLVQADYEGKANKVGQAFLPVPRACEYFGTDRNVCPTLLALAVRFRVVSALHFMSLIDTHTHLESFYRKGALDRVLGNAREAGLGAMITIGTSTDDWALYRTLAETHRGFVHYAVGLHPCSVAENWESEVAQIEAFWEGGGTLLPVALGECGLDRFHLPKDDPARAEQVFAWQRAAFAVQLQIARRLACPVVIHSRGAFEECMRMVDESGVDWARVVFHCFVEGAPQMRELARRGGRGSFTGVLTYKSAQLLREAAREQGLGRFMVETDAPYLTPEPHRGKPNEPAFVRHTAEYAAAKIFGVSFDELARASTRNAREFFGI